MAQLLAPFAGKRAERTACALLNRFGTLERTLSASDEQIVGALDEDKDVGRLIAAARTLVIASLEEKITRFSVDPTSTAFRTYLVLKYRGKANEELHAIFVDRAFGFISEDLVAIGGFHHVQTRVSAILRRGLELDAAGFLLIHNHPSNSPNPSVEDVRATKQTLVLGRSIGIELVDHLIVAGQNVTSMKELGLI